MGPVVSIPTPLRRFTRGVRSVAIEGDSVGVVLSRLAASYPDLRQHLFGEAGDLRGFVNVFVNDINVRDLDGAATPVRESDAIVILPSIAGG